MAPVPAKLGRYEIVKHLANGGMAQVLIARATGIEGFERHVVVKRIHTEHAADPSFVKMFLDEARTAAALHHNNIVQVHDIGKENGEYFFAMEYVHGQDLRILLRENSRRKQKVPWEHVVTIMTSAASGLHHAHELRGPDRKPLGLVHRDVSPANILVGYDGTVKVVDFGIAKAALRTGEGTRGGALKGKVSYMAPEQCAGKPIDRRSDVYALGVVLYEISTVRRLFKGDNDFLTMSAIVSGNIPDPAVSRPDIPPQLSAIILKALARDPKNRYQTADELREALEHFATELRLRTSTGALASYMKGLFGTQLEPWLVDEGAELELNADFDGSVSGVVQANDDAVRNLAVPDGIEAAVSAPIMKARRRITDAPPVSVPAETLGKLPSVARGTGGGARPAAGTPAKPAAVVTPAPKPTDPVSVARTKSATLPPARPTPNPLERKTPPALPSAEAKKTPSPMPAARAPTETPAARKTPLPIKTPPPPVAEPDDDGPADDAATVVASPWHEDIEQSKRTPLPVALPPKPDLRPVRPDIAPQAVIPTTRPDSDVAKLPAAAADDFADEKSSSMPGKPARDESFDVEVETRQPKAAPATVESAKSAAATPETTPVETAEATPVAAPATKPFPKQLVIAGVVAVLSLVAAFLLIKGSGGDEPKQPPPSPPPIENKAAAPEPPVADAAVVETPDAEPAGSGSDVAAGSAHGSGSSVGSAAAGSGTTKSTPKQPRKKWNPDQLFIP